MELIVTEPFDDYAKGDRISDAVAIATALATNPHDVVKIATQKPTEAATVIALPFAPEQQN